MKMMASLRIVRTAPAVSAIIIGSIFLQAIANNVSEVSAADCNSVTTEPITLQSSNNNVKMKCGASFSEFVPADLTKTYEEDNVASGVPVALNSVIHKAVLTVGDDPLEHTLSVNHSTVVSDEKVIYYYCKNPSDSTHCKIKVTVQPRTAKPAVTCKSDTVEKILLDKDDTSIMFACHSTYSTLLPDVNQVYTSETGDSVMALKELYPEATLEKGSGHEYTLKIPNRTSSKVFYYRCQKEDSHVCHVQVTVEKNKKAPGGVPEPAVCTNDVKKVDVTLSAEYPGVAFTCGLDVPTLDPPDMSKAYDSELMNSAVLLSSQFEKAGLYSDPTVAAYTYFLYIPYRKESKKLYYKCKGESEKSCTVTVTVEPNHDVVPVCEDAGKGVYLSYEDFTENVKFKCDAAFPHITPSDLTNVYVKDPATTPSPEAVSLTTVYSGAKLVSDGDAQSPTFTLTIPPHLPRKLQHIYYQCKKAEDSFCTVRIRVAEKKPKMVTCSDGADHRVTITAAGEIVRFKCDEEMTLRPTDAQNVFDNKDNKCSTVADLTKLVPNANLANDSEGQGKVITFNELPTSDKALCYSCAADGMPAGLSAFRAPQTSRQCKVFIDVKSAAQSLNAHTLAGHAFILMSFAGVLFSIL